MDQFRPLSCRGKSGGPRESSPLEIGVGNLEFFDLFFQALGDVPAEIPLITGCDAGSPPESLPGGLSYQQWSAEWWQWAWSIPLSMNPFFDATGVDSPSLLS